jgi:hypothetical protein
LKESLLMNKLLLVLLVLALGVSCAPADNRRDAVKAVIMRYNLLVVEGYRSMNMNPLQEVATEEHATSVYYHMAALGEGKVRMLSHLNQIEFAGITFTTPDTAQVTTRERWDFAHVNITSGRKSYEEKHFPYQMAYDLKKVGDRWLITAIRAVDAGKTPPTKKASEGN